MQHRFFKSLSICCGTLLSAAILALLQAEEYAMVLENKYPQWRDIAQYLRDASHRTRLGEFSRWQKDWLSAGHEMPELANTLPIDINLVDNEATDSDTQEKAPEDNNIAFQKQVKRKAHHIFPKLASQPGMDLQQNHNFETMSMEELLNISNAINTLDWEQKPTEATTETADNAPIAETEGEITPTSPQETDTADIASTDEQEIDANHPTNCRIMMVGDSLMEGLGPIIHRTLRSRKELHFILTAKFSTGLCRPDYFNWPERMEEAINETQPDIIVFFMGANDAQAIFQGKGQLVPFKSQHWHDAYGEKIREMTEIAHKHQCRIIWIGLPPFGGKNARALRETVLAQQAACEQLGITFIDSGLTLADENGQYRTFMTNEQGRNIRIRSADMCHLTDRGNRMLVDQLLPILESTIKEFNKENPHRRLSEEEISRHGYARLQVTIKYRPTRRKRR